MTKRTSGTIVRWGIQGFGFIREEERSAELYFNKKFIRNPHYIPTEGDSVTFEIKEYPGGKTTAQSVEFSPTRENPPVAGRTSTAFSPESIAELNRAKVVVHGLESGVLATSSKSPRTLAEEFESARRSHDDEWARQEDSIGKAETDLQAAQRRVAEIKGQLCEAERTATAKERAVAVARARSKEILERSGASEAELALEWIRKQAQRVAETLAKRREETGFLDESKTRAITRSGLESVARFEDIRARIRVAPDDLSREAYRSLEREYRGRMDEFARALDSVECRKEEEIAVIGFVPGKDAAKQHPIIIVACFRLPNEAMEPEWRIACAFWQATARAVCEIDAEAAIEHGTVAGCPAVRALCKGVDVELAEMALSLALDIAWKERPSLGAWKILPVAERASAPLPAFEAAPGHSTGQNDGEALPSPSGGLLRDVAVQLRLPLRDVAAQASDLGLPHIDDRIDHDAEITLRASFDLTTPFGPDSGEVPQASGQASLSGPRAIAQRLLGKLFRDKRIGGRHTAFEHAWGHHFGAQDKPVARKLAERLIREGILREKFNNGQRHISIEPSRLADLMKLLDGTFPDDALFRDLD